MWVLILSLLGPYEKGSSALATQEFSSKGRCMAAATLYIKQNSDGADRYYSPKPKAVCVPK